MTRAGTSACWDELGAGRATGNRETENPLALAEPTGEGLLA